MSLQYVSLSSHENSDGLGMQILVSLPKGQVLTEELENLVRATGHELYDRIGDQLHHSDPVAIAARTMTRQKLRDVFAGHRIFAEDVPNQYDPRRGTPWLRVTTVIGHITVGWRKRVIVVDWTGTTTSLQAKDLFAEESTTMDGQTIHAWGYPKAAVYVNKLLKEATK
jgi:hypothetical protein